MKKILVVSLIALLAPAMVVAADPASAAGAKSGSAVMGGVSSGTIVAGTLAVAVVGAAVLSNGGDGSSTSASTPDLPAEVDASLDAFMKTLSADEVKSFNYIMVEAAENAQVASLLDAVSAALVAGATPEEVQAAISSVYNAKDKDSAIAALVSAAAELRKSDPALFAVVSEFVIKADPAVVANLGNVIKAMQANGATYAQIAEVIKKETTVVVVTPVHTPSTHFTTPTH